VVAVLALYARYFDVAQSPIVASITAYSLARFLMLFRPGGSPTPPRGARCSRSVVS
jgi:hypothetical protein